MYYQLVKTVNTAIDPIENLSGPLFRVAKNTIINLQKKKKRKNCLIIRMKMTSLLKTFPTCFLLKTVLPKQNTCTRQFGKNSKKHLPNSPRTMCRV